MAHVAKSALVGHSAEQMYQLVIDIDRYQDFLPWCGGSRVLSQSDNEVCGEIIVAKAGIRQAFSTCNALIENQRVGMDLRDGPFKTLTGAWEFIPLRKDACKVVLDLEFSFSGKLIEMAFGKIFMQVADTMVDSFCKRANEVYDG